MRRTLLIVFPLGLAFGLGSGLGWGASPATTQSAATKPKVTVGGVKPAPGKKYPAMLVLAGDGDEIRGTASAILGDREWVLVTVHKTESTGRDARPGGILPLVQAQPFSGSIDPNRIVLLTGPKGAETLMEVLDRDPGKIAAAVFISAAPVRRTPEAIQLWQPDKETWKVPMWATTGTDPKGAVQVLLMWRQVAASAPKNACLTIDPRAGEAGGYPVPDDGIGKWLDAIAAGKAPSVGPDRQAEAERGFYEKFAAEVLEAMKAGTAAEAGQAVAKTQAPMEVKVVAPKGWQRDERGETAYDAETSPFVQLYLTPAREGQFFARVCGAKWSGKAADLLADYDKRLGERGFLVIPYRQWTAGAKAFQISSVLWPTKDKWHRWLIVSAAGDGGERAKAAPLIMVMDASARPDPKAMAAAIRTLADSMSVQWIGGEPRRDAGDAGDKKPGKAGMNAGERR